MANPPSWPDQFIEALAENSNVSDVCRRLSIARRTVYERKLSDPVFAKRFADAIAVTMDLAEATAYSRAIDGVEEPIFDKTGTRVGEITRYDNTLLMRLLAAHKPIYRQNSGVELSGALQLSNLSDADLNAQILALQAKLKDEIPDDAADDDSAGLV